MLYVPITLATASVTVLAAGFYIYTVFRVGNMRGKHNIKAPACTGHPEFDRAYRVQMNTLEQLVIVLPLLWIGTLYPIGMLVAWLAPLVGLIWVLSRVVYLRGYMADPEKRVAGAMIGGICSMLLLLIAIVGLVRAWMIV